VKIGWGLFVLFWSSGERLSVANAFAKALAAVRALQRRRES